MLEEIPVVFHNGSNYDCCFIIKELAGEPEGQFGCLGLTTEKYLKFPLPIDKEIGKCKTRTYKIKFIDSVGFISHLLSCLADNFVERLRKDKYENHKSDLEYKTVKEAHWYSNV